jgi:CBS domain-containing protein
MTAGDVMTANPTTVSPDESLVRVVDLIVEQHISGLPVVEQGKLVGIVTETDLLRLLSKLLGG